MYLPLSAAMEQIAVANKTQVIYTNLIFTAKMRTISTVAYDFYQKADVVEWIPRYKQVQKRRT